MEHDLSKQYWNNRYLTDDFKWDIGYPSPPLIEYTMQLQNKNLKILIPGAGNSYEAEYLYNHGFKNVYVLDFAQQALDNFKNRVPNFPVQQLINQNFFEHHGQYDLILEQTFFCALHPSLRHQYVQHMYALLKQSGKLVGVLFNDALNETQPPFGGNKNTYQLLFEGIFKIKKMELCYNSISPRKDRELFILFEK
ncbi:MAG: methyltransferase domain-containing protein [Bacteroidia bacterium]|nr:methyltransferase domain-containing protein [Bacteroidia bacterium]